MAAPNPTPGLDVPGIVSGIQETIVQQTSQHKGEGKCGPGYMSPTEAMKGPREKVIYVTCIATNKNLADHLATVDVDPTSKTYSQVLHRLYMPYAGDELHHTGWNVCSSCYGETFCRDKLIMPCLLSDRVYVVDVGTDGTKQPSVHRIIEPAELHARGLATPHTTHCLPNGEIMISTLGKPDGSAQGSFLMLDARTFKVNGVFSKDTTKFGYDFWYQPYFNVLMSSQWGAPKSFKKGFNPMEIGQNPPTYGQCVDVWTWKTRKLIQTIDLGENGRIPLEIRFLHNPRKPNAVVGCALSSTIFQIFRTKNKDKEGNRKWDAKQIIAVTPKPVTGWLLPVMPGLITDIIVSMDDKYLFFSDWLHGDIRMYDITKLKAPKLVGQVFIGGSITSSGKVTVTDAENDKELPGGKQPDALVVQGRIVTGGPQMLQLSLDGLRLYVTTSLFTPWDTQFYPDLIKTGSVMLQIDILPSGTQRLVVNRQFLVDFGKEGAGPVLAHEMRYPGGDCTSDIFLVCPKSRVDSDDVEPEADSADEDVDDESDAEPDAEVDVEEESACPCSG